MEENTSSIESLIEKATEYGKTSFDLAKLKAIDKASEVVSSLIAQSLVLFVVSSFLLFLSLGLALWLGDILGKTYLGFLSVAAIYAIAALLIHFVLRGWLMKSVGNNLIKQVLK